MSCNPSKLTICLLCAAFIFTGCTPSTPVYNFESGDLSYYLEEAIQQFPDTIFILGHAGWDSYNRELTYVDACIDLATRYENVYMEPGALGADRAAEVLPDFVTRIKRAGLAHKLIYGSDGPQFPGYIGKHLEAFVAAMQAAGYTVDEMRLILADNFSRIMGLPKFRP